VAADTGFEPTLLFYKCGTIEVERYGHSEEEGEVKLYSESGRK
jgi:hypothetical protein